MLKEKMIEVMSSILNVNAEEITEDTSTDTIEVWDSLRHIQIVLALEEEFKVEFDEDIVPDMTSFQKIYSVLEEKLNE